jgi:hypothetical protein
MFSAKVQVQSTKDIVDNMNANREIQNNRNHSGGGNHTVAQLGPEGSPANANATQLAKQILQVESLNKSGGSRRRRRKRRRTRKYKMKKK